MNGPLFDKREFLQSENKNQFMRQILTVFSKLDEQIRAGAAKQPDAGEQEQIREELNARQSRAEQQAGEDIRKIQERIDHIDNEIDTIRKDLMSKRQRMEKIEQLFEQQIQRAGGQPGIQNRIRELSDEIQDMKQRLKAESLNKDHKIQELLGERAASDRRIADVKSELQSRIGLIQNELQCRLRESGRNDTERLCAGMEEILPPALTGGAVSSLRKYDISALQGEPQYLLQCTVGSMSYVCRTTESRSIAEKYQSLLSGNAVKVPYVISRNRAVYQAFLYRDRSRDEVWQHFQTMCAAQILLHQKFGYELSAVCADERPFLQRQRPEEQKLVKMIKPCETAEQLGQIQDYCQSLREQISAGGYSNIWEYNRDHPQEPFPYRGVAFWDFPGGLDADTVRRIGRLYGEAERCGVFFLFMVNTDLDIGKEAEEALTTILNGLNPLRYLSERQRYEEMRMPSVLYQIHNYDA